MSFRTATAFGLAIALATSSTTAIAATRAPAPINPLATISAFGSPAAATVLCGNAAPAAAAGAAAATQVPSSNCVLPVVDQAPVAAREYVPPPVYSNAILPALLVIGGLVAWALLFGLSDDDDDDNGVPVSAT